MQEPVTHILIDDSGHPRTINGRVKVHIIVEKYQADVAIEDIARHYNLTLADVYAALAYYHDNLSYFEEREHRIEPLKKTAKARATRLRATIENRLAQTDEND